MALPLETWYLFFVCFCFFSCSSYFTQRSVQTWCNISHLCENWTGEMSVQVVTESQFSYVTCRCHRAERSGRNENQHLKIWDSGSQPEKWLGVRRSPIWRSLSISQGRAGDWQVDWCSICRTADSVWVWCSPLSSLCSCRHQRSWVLTTIAKSNGWSSSGCTTVLCVLLSAQENVTLLHLQPLYFHEEWSDETPPHVCKRSVLSKQAVAEIITEIAEAAAAAQMLSTVFSHSIKNVAATAN